MFLIPPANQVFVTSVVQQLLKSFSFLLSHHVHAAVRRQATDTLRQPCDKKKVYRFSFRER
jgi:hypothetical protein